MENRRSRAFRIAARDIPSPPSSHPTSWLSARRLHTSDPLAGLSARGIQYQMMNERTRSSREGRSSSEGHEYKPCEPLVSPSVAENRSSSIPPDGGHSSARSSLVNWSFDEKVFPQSVAAQYAEPKSDGKGGNQTGRRRRSSGGQENELSENSRLPRVLVVDDATSNRKMLCRVLRSRCSSIVETDNGQKAVDIVKESMLASDSLVPNNCQPFDLILMDFVMPVMDGPTAIKEIRGLGYTGLIFGLTGNALESDKELLLVNGANVVLTKPFDLGAFDQAILETKRPKVQVVNPSESKKSRSVNFGDKSYKGFLSLPSLSTTRYFWNRNGAS